MTQSETAMSILIKSFDTYATGDGEKGTLSNAEAKTLLEKELHALLKQNPEEVDRLLKRLDSSGDSEVDFAEFMRLVSDLARIYHDNCPGK
uniref:Protein S100-P-like n=1 Tax=Stegastes partitus TaxID=144197 RepID=A0A3B4ZU20_9TELE